VRQAPVTCHFFQQLSPIFIYKNSKSWTSLLFSTILVYLFTAALYKFFSELRKCGVTLNRIVLYNFKEMTRRRDIQHNDTQYNDTQHNNEKIWTPSIKTLSLSALLQ
jgi:hypothetical protein